MLLHWRSQTVVRIGIVACWVGVFATDALAEKRALLVGCTKYPHLESHLWLDGPGNDVELLKSVLMSRFGLSEENIQTLAGWDGVAKEQRPTRANIERAFGYLARSAGSGDIIVILMSGHGSQQPAAPGDAEHPNVEPDGLDEIFLPADVGKWPGHDDAAKDVIVDNDIRAWLDAIRVKGAFVWIIFDSCNSGTMTRGVTDERSRRVAPEDLGISRKALDSARNRAASGTERSRGNDSASGSMVDSGTGTGGYAAIYAARPYEPTPEVPLPRGVPGHKSDVPRRKYHGLLTWTICELLKQYGNRLTYRDLEQLIAQRYQGWPRSSPSPFAEGDVERQVLGRERATDRAILQIRKGRGGALTVSGGALAGLTRDSILAVFRTARSAGDKLVGHVVVREVSITSAVVEPYHDDAHQALNPKSLPEVNRCEIVWRDLGDMKLRLVVQVPDTEAQTRGRGDNRTAYRTLTWSQFPDPLAAAIKVIEERQPEEGGARGLFEITENPHEADWVLEFAHGKVKLFPATGFELNARGGVSESAVRRGPFGGDDPKEMGRKLGTALQRIYRWRNLRRIAGQLAVPDSETGEGDTGTLDPRIRVSLLRASERRKGEWVRTSPGERLQDGAHLRIKMENTGRVALDVTLLVLDADFGITSLFPSAKGEQIDNRLGGGQTLTLGIGRTRSDPKITVNLGDTAGPEYLVAIAVPAAGSRLPSDFSWLQQSMLARAKSVGQTRGGGHSLESPLGRLLRTASYGEGGTRGLGLSSDSGENAIFTVMSYKTVRK